MPGRNVYNNGKTHELRHDGTSNDSKKSTRKKVMITAAKKVLIVIQRNHQNHVRKLELACTSFIPPTKRFMVLCNYIW